MNKVCLVGRLTNDAEVRHNGDMYIATFTLAVDRHVARNAEGGQTADFIRCVGFGKRAEFLEKFGQKGKKFCITGRIQTGSYTDKDGKKVYTTDVVVEDIEFAESLNKSVTEEKTPAPVKTEEFMAIPDGIDAELPFA